MRRRGEQPALTLLSAAYFHSCMLVVCHVMLLCDNSYFQQMAGCVPSHDIAHNVFRPNASHGWKQGLRSLVVVKCSAFASTCLSLHGALSPKKGGKKMFWGGEGTRGGDV